MPDSQSKILLLGVGNTLRGDDGIADFVCREFLRQHPNAADSILVHQLNIELLEDLMRFDHIVIIDAAVDGPPLLFGPLPEQTVPAATSHNINAALLSALARSLYGRDLSMMVCAVRGYEFAMGAQLSVPAERAGMQAVGRLWQWVISVSG